MKPTVDDVADKVTQQQAATPEAQARQRRRALQDLHARLRSDEESTELDDDEINELFTLTDEVLGLESRAAEHRGAHRRSSRMIYAATGVLVLGSAALLTVGILRAWVSGWGIVAAAVAIAVGLLMAGAHAVADPSRHRERTLLAGLAAAAGLALAALTTGWLPWWTSLIALVLLLLVTGAFAATVKLEPPHASGDEN